MKHTLKIAAVTAGLCLSGLSGLAQAQTGESGSKYEFDLKLDGVIALPMLKGGRGGSDDDHGRGRGRGRGASDDSSDDGSGGSGRRRPRVPGGSGCDDAGDIAEHPECSVNTGSVPTGSGGASTSVQVSSVEISANGDVEIRLSDGTKEELSGGRYEVKNASNRTVIQRIATADDIARIQRLAGL